MTPAEHLTARAAIDKAEAYARRTMGTRGPRCSFITAEEAKHPDYAAVDNELRGRVEQYEINVNPPERFVAYLSGDESTVTGWTGLPFGRVIGASRYRSNMGDHRVTFRTRIAGRTYSGTGYGGGGMYCRLRLVKES